jgi:DNA uptake protein ComE-like DNA-binding protein
MATPAEKKALLFLGVITLLGGAVRLWRAQRPIDIRLQGAASYSNAASKSTSIKAAKTKQKSTKSRTPKKTPPAIDIPIDLDVATVDEIEALGVLKPGVARMIVANRDSFGPFGSIRALERIPYLRKTTITTLAPLVTFSRVPRPMNAVLPARSDIPRRSPSRKYP